MRIYFDENFSPALISGLKRIQDGRRSEGIDVCSVKEEFGQGCRDEEWIPEIAKRHGVIITQDLNINRTRAQWQLCRNNKIGIFFVRPPKKGWSYWDIVRLVIHRWPEISNLAKETRRPFGFHLEYGSRKIKPL